MSQLEKIKGQMCGRSEFDEAIKPENQKIFPFYIFTNFNTSKIIALEDHKFDNFDYTPLESAGALQGIDTPIKCEYCSAEEEPNHGGYYTMYIVFESADDIRACCNVHRCRKGFIYEFNHQEYGFKTPIELNQYSASGSHLAVYKTFFSHSNAYKLRRYEDTGITVQIFDKEFNTSEGGSMWDGNGHEWNKRHLIGKVFGETFKLTKGQIVEKINEIIISNRTSQKPIFKQLELFA